MAGTSDDIQEVDDQAADDQEVPESWQGLLAEAEQLDEPAPGEQLPPDNQVEADLDSAELLAGVIGPLFVILAPAWEVTAPEVDALASAYGKVLDKYFPGGLSMGPELGAVMATVAVIGPRLRLPRKEPPPVDPSGGAGDQVHTDGHADQAPAGPAQPDGLGYDLEKQ